MASHEISANATTIMIIPATSELLDVNVVNQYDEDMDMISRPSGGLTPVDKCCLKKQCFKKFAPQVQEDCFNRFWSIRSKSNQNYFLAGLMSADEPKRTVQNPIRHNKTVSWSYFVDVRGKKVQVCQNFLTGIYGISSSKIQTIQHKLLSGSSLDDLRGRFSKRKKDLDDDNEDEVSLESNKRINKKKDN
ncbi:uncharacterized protein LOC128951897 [Oppia nitens]|uniref:uncharacterized protein LOC128951897 n=1 Tax=Oppia nitens TaxID=1686743 RepID=UPI0023DC4CCB|nr:uncharacterized protein LOC128951897 [Oppia nitens]